MTSSKGWKGETNIFLLSSEKRINIQDFLTQHEERDTNSQSKASREVHTKQIQKVQVIKRG